MAITKIHPVKHTVGKSIAYIGNDAKTEDGKLQNVLTQPKERNNEV